jgi:hypothetical protein
VATTAQVTEIRQATGELVKLAGRELDEFWDALFQSMSPEDFRDELLKFYPDLITAYGDTAGVIGADWYEVLRSARKQGVSAARFRATIAIPAPDEQSIRAAKWALGPFFDEQADSVLSLNRLQSTMQRLVMQPFRDSIWYAAASDPVRTGVLRKPTGLFTCKFCVMLASRGPVYSYAASGASTAGSVIGRGSTRTGFDGEGNRISGGIGGGIVPRGKQPLGNAYHDDCDCVPVVIQSSADIPEDYDQKVFERLYAEGSGVGRDLPVSL